MTELAIIGFVAVTLGAFAMTLTTIGIAYIELGFEGRLGPLTLIYSAITASLWALTAWLSPFTVTFGVAA